MKNIVLCSTLNPECIQTLKTLSGKIDLTNATIHIVTMIKLHIPIFNMAPYIYPEAIHNAYIETEALKLLKEIGDTLNIAPTQIIYNCSFKYDVKESMKTYLEEINADLAVVAIREKSGIKGFFQSSFSDYLTKFSPCDVLVLKNKMIHDAKA